MVKNGKQPFLSFFDHGLKIFFFLYCKMILFPTALLAEDPTFMMFCYDLSYIKTKI
ncbi:hypothetical protein NT05HA_0054 [Aggregatibacter aphrophilus NJ8700]|nr:hypothetical protein NT05HA_0054 [Aggregatibacter aphrophilus NJ8700]